jgi:hypothetical protein
MKVDFCGLRGGMTRERGAETWWHNKEWNCKYGRPDMLGKKNARRERERS